MSRVGLVLCALASVGCAEGAPEHASKTRSAIIGGGASSDPATVLVEVLRPPTSTVPPRAARCTGTLVAPGLVLTARHCILKAQVEAWGCTADGAPTDPKPALDLADVAWITVGVGANVDTLEKRAVQRLLTPPAVSLCRADFAFLVLDARDGATHATYLRRAVGIRDTFSVTGWGYQGNTDVLPVTPNTLEALPITNVGPGVVPSGTFTTRGGTLCPGDSGAVARVEGAVAGVFSRAEHEDCSRADNRVLFDMLFGYEDFVARAHAEVGDTPRFTATPAATDSDASTGAPPAQDAGPTQGADAASAGCDTAGTTAPTDGAPLALVFALAIVLRRRLRAGCSCASSAGSCRACL